MKCQRYDGLVVNAIRKQVPCSSSHRSAAFKVSHLPVPNVLRETGGTWWPWTRGRDGNTPQSSSVTLKHFNSIDSRRRLV